MQLNYFYIISSLISRHPKINQFILLVIDIAIIIGSLLISFFIYQERIYLPTNVIENKILWLVFVAPLIALPIFYYFSLYRAIMHYLEIRASFAVIKAVSLYSLIWALIVIFSKVEGIPLSFLLINFMITLLGIGGSRIIIRYLLSLIRKSTRKIMSDTVSRVLIFGAGEAGRQLAFGLTHSFDYQLCGFVDENTQLHGRELMGCPILSYNNLSTYVREKKITDLLLAIPSLSRKERNRILHNLYSLPLRIRTLPGLFNLVHGQVYTTDLQDLDIDDLLMRQAIEPNEDLMKKQVNNKIILVTGAGGSIGSEICRQVLQRFPKTLILFELNEYALYSIHQELLSHIKKFEDYGNFYKPKLIPLLGSIQDEKRLNKIFMTLKPEVIYHTAAYKHVPMVEDNIAEGIKNNVFGTLIVAKISIEHEVSKFVFISTDKAVNPTNIMGASKRIAEMTIQSMAPEIKIFFNFLNNNSSQFINKTNFSIVRFGNVLNSSGSVIPFFKKQIQNGGPITITDMNVSRYFMTISEAAQLVIQSGALSINQDVAEIFVLDMNEPVKIYDLACRMVKMSGLRIKDENNPNGDIAFEIIGLRPGEKLHEELLIGNNPQPTPNVKILKANEEFVVWDKLQEQLNLLKTALDKNDLETIFDILNILVKGYDFKTRET